ncbi:hypothetical protein NDU88_006044 [Pleurodeles waltl]|uniref:Uncharacterized protein n=1 Tax=Pleurodeles waltl TaxID=8319 RepID=A0AAV7TCH4_PLEWA|nr:hypothetical protein NDU88_006044 [Pleurodeles waltl]
MSGPEPSPAKGCERKRPAHFRDTEEEQACMRPTKTRGQANSSPELDEDLQGVLKATRRLVAQQGKQLVYAQVMAPLEQEGLQKGRKEAKPRQPTKEHIQESGGVPWPKVPLNVLHAQMTNDPMKNETAAFQNL